MTDEPLGDRNFNHNIGLIIDEASWFLTSLIGKNTL